MKKITCRNKKLLAGALALSMALPTTVYAGKSLVKQEPEATASQAFLRGDVDGNGAIGLDDAAQALKYALKIETPETELKKAAADANGDGTVGLDDAQQILKWALRIEEQPTPEPSKSETPASETPVSEAPVSETPASEAPASEAPVSEAPASKKPIQIPTIPPVQSTAPATRTPVPKGAEIPTVAAVDYVVTADSVAIAATNGAVEENGIYTLTDANAEAGKGIQFKWPYAGRTDLVQTLEEAGITDEVIGEIPADKLLKYKDEKTALAEGGFDFSYEYPRPNWNTGISISFWSKQKWEQEGQSNFSPVLTIKRTAYCDKHLGTSEGGYGDVTNRHGSKGDCDYALVVCANGSVAFECGDASKNEFRGDNYIADQDGEWTFYTVTIANDWITVYINGQEMVYQSVDLNKDARCEYFNAGFMTRYNPAGYISQEMLDKDIRKYLVAKGSAADRNGAYYQKADGTWETNWEATLIGNSIYKAGSLTNRKQLLMELLTSEDTEMWFGGVHVCTLRRYEESVREYSTASGAQVAGLQCYDSELKAGEVAAVYENSVQQYKDVLGLK